MSNHKYPGIDRGLRDTWAKDYPVYDIAAHPECPGTPAELLQVREVAMMVLMDRLTDKPDWTEKVKDDQIVAKWRKEAMAVEFEQMLPVTNPAERTRLISEKAFDYCIAELRCKAEFFKESGLIYTLDSGDHTHNIIKSDVLVKPDLHVQLKTAMDKLLADQASNPDWHPRTDDMVWDVVHPSMYPFVYNRTRFIHDEVVGIEDAIDKWSGKGIVPTQNKTSSPKQGSVPDDRWSETYQWLPSNLAIQDDGTVKFTSYINNLHPTKYRGIYTVIEKLIDTAMPAWDHALHGQVFYKTTESKSEQKRGIRFDLPPEYYEGTETAAWQEYNAQTVADYEAAKGKLEFSEDDVQDAIENIHWREDIEEQDPETIAKWKEEALRHLKWKEIRDPFLPEPLDFAPVTYKNLHGDSIRDRFKNNGLQVYVKMASIELTPEKPSFPAGGWHIEGQLNEQIVATALYYVDSDNVTPSSLSFRKQCDEEQEALQERVGQSMFDYYERLYCKRLGYNEDEAVQYFGDVVTQQGRLLAFPNVYQHRVSGFELKDKTKPGHRRFIALWLVNPTVRVISTANVPPQQFDWWYEALVGGAGKKGEIPPEVMQLVLDKKSGGALLEGEAEAVNRLTSESKTSRLPPEILEMVRKDATDDGTQDGLMTVEEAKEHRIKLMDERSQFQEKSEQEWRSFSFCEH
ncbi:Protein of unknown function (DUF4246) domain containing protein [Naviculisporaceae sp. PSN 640]